MAVYDDEWFDSVFRQRGAEADAPADVPNAEAIERAARNIAEQLYRQPGSDKPDQD